MIFWEIGRNEEVIVSIVILLSASLTFADLITYTGSIPATANHFNQPISVPLFNSSLGTLDSMLVSFNTNTSGTISATNNGDADTFSVDLQENVYCYWPDNSCTWAFSKPAHNYGSPYVGAGETKVYTVDSFAGSSSYTETDLAYLQQFVGSGNTTFTFDAGVDYLWAATYHAPYTVAADLDTAIGWTIQYNYTVPEPMTVIILGLGCLLFRRK
jgi:hypothetical protein